MGWFAVVIDPEGTEVGPLREQPRTASCPRRGARCGPQSDPMRLIDSHCHLQADRFDGDADAVLEAARAAGVERILVPGWNAWSSDAALELVDRHRWLDAAVGVHPHDAAKVTDAEWARIAATGRATRASSRSGRPASTTTGSSRRSRTSSTNLRRNLALALETGKPAILHVRSPAGRRDAQDALLGELRAAGFGGPAPARAFGDRPPALLHSFSGPVDFARAALDLNLAISISGLAFRKGEEATAEVAALVPADRLLVETDSPFLSPPGAPRGRNAPEWVRLTAAWVAERRGIAADDTQAWPRSATRSSAAYDGTFAHRG